MSVVITGNKNYGVAKFIGNYVDCIFASRDTGLNLKEDWEGFITECMINYDTIIINATVKKNTYTQTKLLFDLYSRSVELNLAKNFIAISGNEKNKLEAKETIKYLSYGNEAAALERLCKQINLNKSTISPNIKCCLITFPAVKDMYESCSGQYIEGDKIGRIVKQVIEEDVVFESITLG